MPQYATKKAKAQYRAPVKKPRDPNLPPPENLFSQGKKIRDMQASSEDMRSIIARQADEIAALQRKVRVLDYRLDILSNQINSRK